MFCLVKKTILKQPLRKVAGRIPTPAAAMIVHEDEATCQRAKAALNEWSRRFDPTGTGIKTKLWKLDSLAQPLMNELAIVEAVTADVLVLSLHGTRELPEAVHDWLGGWLERKEERPYSLGIILDPHVLSQGKNHPVVAYLEQVAAIGAAEVFHAAVASPAATWEETQLHPQDERSRYISEVIKSILRHSEPHPEKGSNE